MVKFKDLFHFDNWKRKLNRKIAHRKENGEYRAIVANFTTPVTLTNEEIDEIHSIWGQLGLHINMDVHKMMKGWGYFDARVVPFPIQAVIHPILVPIEYTKVMSHKSMIALWFNNRIRMPQILVSCIDYTYYDNNGEVLTFDSAVNILKNNDFFVKPSIGTYGGLGTLKILSGTSNSDICDIIKSYNGNFLACEIVQQHSQMAFANSSSVNTLRLNTLNLNGKVSVVSAMFRYGTKGAIVDNLGGGGITATITEEGNLLPTIIGNKGYSCGKMDESLQKFYGTKFPFFDIAAKYVCEMHKKFFIIAKTIPWDVAIDKEGNPVVIEINFGSSGTMFCEPIFGSRTQEVIDYVKPRLNWLYTKHRPELNLEYSDFRKTMQN